MTDSGRPIRTPDEGVGRWMAVQYVILAVWVVAIALAFGIDADPVIVIGAAAISSFVIWFFVDPRRSWWGPGPRRILSDRTARRRYQIRMTVAMIVLLVIAIPAAVVVVEVVGPSVNPRAEAP